MPFPWNFRRQTLFKDDRVVQTELLTAKMYEHFMAMKEHISYKADITRLRSRTQNICFFISISAVSYFEANGQNHIHFRLIQVLKKTSNRTAENLPQRKLWAAHDARSQRGLWSHRTSEGVLLRKRQIFALSSSDPINYEVRLLRISEWLICISLSLQ